MADVDKQLIIAGISGTPVLVVLSNLLGHGLANVITLVAVTFGFIALIFYIGLRRASSSFPPPRPRDESLHTRV